MTADLPAMISVIVPVHNTLRYLEECFDSVLGQDVDFELVIVDDGSTDGSSEVCRRYASRPGVVLIHTAHIGPSGSRNAGIAGASGEYITFLDSDDRLLPGSLSYMLSLLEKHSDCPIAVGQFTRDENYSGSESSCTRLFTADAQKAIINSLYQKGLYQTSAWGKLYRRELFRDISLFAEGRWYEDLEIFVRLYLKSGKLVITSRKVYFYRRNPVSFINTVTPGRRDMLWATAKVQSDVARDCPAAIAAARSRRFSSLFNMYNLAVSSGDHTTAGECMTELRTLRRAILLDPHVRLRNKLGALLTFLGNRVCTLAARFYRLLTP